MRRSSASGMLFGCGLMFGLACADTTGLGREPGGHFALIAFEGKALPATVAEIVRRDFTPSGCFERVTSGWLMLDAQSGAFSFGARHEDTCGHTSFGDDTTAYGRYEIHGDEIFLFEDVGVWGVRVARAQVRKTTIELSDQGWRYRFAR